MKKLNIPVLVLALLIHWVGIFDHSLWAPDEPREAQIIREMALSGEYLIPSLSGRAFLEKPPLYYVAGTIVYKLFGGLYPEAGRITSALFSSATLLVIMLASRRFFDHNTSALSPLVLATSAVYFLSSHKILIDVGLVFFVTAAMCSFLTAYLEKSRNWYRVFWLCMALSFLAKGMIGLAIPLSGIFLFILWKRDFSIVKDAWTLQGVFLVLAVMALWGWVLYMKGGFEYVHAFYIYNQIGRFLPNGGGIYLGGHHRPFHSYITGIWVHAAPWSLLLIPAAARIRNLQDSEKFMWSWLAGGMLLLSLASTKREIYFLPMYPAVAMIVASWMSGIISGRAYKWEDRFLLVVTALILSAAIALPFGYVWLGGPWPVAAGITILSGSIFGLLWRRYRNALPFFAVVGCSMVIIVWTAAAFPVVDQYKSYKEMYTTMGKLISNEKVAGYYINETVEALGNFYGGFNAGNIEDRTDLAWTVDTGDSRFIIVFPGRMDRTLKRYLRSRADLVYEAGGKHRREIELWKIRSFP
jgi:4-amino-4-deoxy-L-arabinose transferase-like glycosyltransferase